MRASKARNDDVVIVLDFETTGLSPDNGDRAIEIGAVRIERGRITDRFQKLMNPGMPISSFIETYTGITNSMLRKASPCKKVMKDFADFIEDFDLVAHNASFDKRFLDAELKLIRHHYPGNFACSMLLARRIFPDAPNHQLGTLVASNHIPNDGTFHRALADAEMTAHLWLTMLEKLKHRYQIDDIPFSLMQKISRVPKAGVQGYLQQWARNQE